MSLSFDGTDDLVTRTTTVTLGVIQTLALWIRPTTLGETQNGFLVAHGTGSVPRLLFTLINTPANTYQVRSGRSTDGIWTAPANSVAFNTWQHAAVTYDGSATANNAEVFLNGAAVTTTRAQAPSGAIGADTQILYLGNSSGATRTFDGLMGEVAIWTRLLSAAEIAAVYHLGVHAVPDVVDYLPLDSGRTQALGSAGATYTISGATGGLPGAAENPPIRPAGRRG